MKRAASLAATAVVAFLLMVNVFRFWLLEATLAHGDDFRFYYAMARVGLTYGWSRIYDLDLQCAPIGPIAEATSHCPALALPPVAWIVAPLTALPYTTAYPIWVVLLMLCFGAIVALLWPVLPQPKPVYAAAAFTPFPVAYCLFLGQVTVVAVLGVVLCWWLLRSGRPALAGVALVLALAKPQTVLLVPVALAVAGHWRTVATFAAAALAVGVTALATLGAHGLTAYQAIAGQELGWEVNYVYTLAGLLGRPAATVLEYGLGLVALATAWRFRGRLDAVVLCGLVGSALFSPYWHVADFVVLVPAAALQLSLGPRVPATLLALGLLVVGSPFAVGVTFLPAVVQVGSWLLLEVTWLVWLATRPTAAFSFAPGREELSTAATV